MKFIEDQRMNEHTIEKPVGKTGQDQSAFILQRMVTEIQNVSQNTGLAVHLFYETLLLPPISSLRTLSQVDCQTCLIGETMIQSP